MKTYLYKYYKVDGFDIKYNLYTDALNKALIHFTNATGRVKECYESTTNKQTAEQYEIVNCKQNESGFNYETITRDNIREVLIFLEDKEYLKLTENTKDLDDLLDEFENLSE